MATGGQVWCPALTGEGKEVKVQVRYLPLHDKMGDKTLTEIGDGKWEVLTQHPILYYHTAPQLGMIVPATYAEIARVSDVIEGIDLGIGWLQTSLMTDSGVVGEPYPPDEDVKNKKMKKCMQYLDLGASKKNKGTFYAKCIAWQLKYADDENAPSFQPESPASGLSLALLAAFVGAVAMGVVAFRRARATRTALQGELETQLELE